MVEFMFDWLGQARKSLWIETNNNAKWRDVLLVRLVRACGSKRLLCTHVLSVLFGQARKSLWIETAYRNINLTVAVGQARKSLWIETYSRVTPPCWYPVRLVRACGSKPSRCWNSACLLPVRLVRACGSKHRPDPDGDCPGRGQARKSLWIETALSRPFIPNLNGQARKSLWIETHLPQIPSTRSFGQARKSLWIETG